MCFPGGQAGMETHERSDVDVGGFCSNSVCEQTRIEEQTRSDVDVGLFDWNCVDEHVVIFAHTRFDVAVGADDWYWLLEHDVIALHEPGETAEGATERYWFDPQDGQLMQAPFWKDVLYFPLGHDWQDPGEAEPQPTLCLPAPQLSIVPPLPGQGVH